MSILAKILASKVPEVAAAKAQTSLAELETRIREQAATRSLQEALRRPAGAPLRVLSEFKRASPSAGAIFAGAQPEDVCPIYEQAGAAGISILTDRDYFDGELGFLDRARACVALPLLRKDFVIDSYQVAEARAHGADAVLLIVAALEDGPLRELFACAQHYGLDALVEVHSEAECERALACGATLLGVNHRDLKTFTIDLDLSAKLAPMVPNDAVLVAESGIKTRADAERVKAGGAHAILVGESLMRADSPGQLLRELVSE